MGATTGYAELEIGLHRQQADDVYRVELRFTDPDPKNAAEVAPGAGTFVLDDAGLLERHLDPAGYGQALAEQLFADTVVREAYARARAVVKARDLELRVRLLIGPSAQNLQALRWELLAEPTTKSPFATSERTLFSRFMLSSDWRPIRLRPKADLRALVAVAAPDDWTKWNVAEVLRDGEIERARAALDGIAVDVLDAPLTLGRLLARLREQDVDVLYLVCHGLVKREDRQPYLLFQKDDGTGLWTPGEELARGVAELRQAPRLAVLASCRSAAMAPRLAEAGIPALVAMQGDVKMRTVETALPVFFRELAKDGQIDRAMAVARGAARDEPDHWMPALYLRLKGGRIWYEPRFGEGEADFRRWDAIVSAVRGRRFTPILGSGLSDAVYGSSRDNAARLAAAHRFPLAPHQRDDLPQVAQYLRVSQSAAFARQRLKEQLRAELLHRHGRSLPEELGEAKLPKLLRAVGKLRRHGEGDPYALLARLPAKVYITANPDNLLGEALTAAEREPDSYFCNWRRSRLDAGLYDGEPSVKRPLVYHILGYFKDEGSLVLTEDDYFDYLIGTTENRELVPEVVREATAASALLFLGFQLTDWAFRVLFRIIMRQQGGARRDDYEHVAVQVDPEEHHLIDPSQAREYLCDYFRDANISIYWGHAEDFLQELARRLAEAGKVAPAAVEDDERDW